MSKLFGNSRVALGVCLILAALWGALSGDLPTGSASPIPDIGLRVLVTYPEATRDQLPAGQKALLVSPTLRGYLDSVCVKDTHGDREWRVWPDSEKPGADQPIWQKLMAIASGKGTWLVVADGKRGTSQSLPPDETALMALLKPYGGGS